MKFGEKALAKNHTFTASLWRIPRSSTLRLSQGSPFGLTLIPYFFTGLNG